MPLSGTLGAFPAALTTPISVVVSGLVPCGYAYSDCTARPQNIHHILQLACEDTDYIVRQENLLPSSDLLII
jgi:hypothetical protein